MTLMVNILDSVQDGRDGKQGTLVTIDPLRIGQCTSITQDRHLLDAKPDLDSPMKEKGQRNSFSSLAWAP